MTPHRLLKWGCLTIGAICLTAGYAAIGQWVLLVLAILSWLAGIFTAGWSALVFVVYVGLAAAGIIVGAWPIVMILGATLALAGWDLANWENFVASGPRDKSISQYGWKHYANLGLALGSGLLVTIVGRLVNFRLPFGILAGLVVLVFLGVDLVLRLQRE